MTERPLRVALLCSERAAGLDDLLSDPNRGVLYQISCAVTSAATAAPLERAGKAGIPCHVHSIRDWYRNCGAPTSDLTLRAPYDEKTAEILASHEPDLILLASYLYVLTWPMLSTFPQRILNVHDSDLTLKDGHGRPRYRGLHSVRDAIFSGERQTRATVHLVTEGVDEGPPLLRSWPFLVAPLVRDARAWEARDILGAYAYAHREWMIRSAWGQLLSRSIELVATGRTRFCPGGAWIDHIHGPWNLRESEDGSVLESPAGRIPITVGVWGD